MVTLDYYNFLEFLKRHKKPDIDLRTQINVYKNNAGLAKAFNCLFKDKTFLGKIKQIAPGTARRLKKDVSQIRGMMSLRFKTFDIIGILMHEYEELRAYNQMGFPYDYLCKPKFYSNEWSRFKWLAHSMAWWKEYAFYQKLCERLTGEFIPKKAFYLVSPYFVFSTDSAPEPWLITRFFKGDFGRERELLRTIETKPSNFYTALNGITLNFEEIQHSKEALKDIQAELKLEILEKHIVSAMNFFQKGGYDYKDDKELVKNNAMKLLADIT